MAPDYNNCIVNLVAAFLPIIGKKPRGYQPLDIIKDDVQDGRTHILLIIDGLGDTFLQKFPESFLYHHRRTKITSVFPPTTATALTSFFTGVAPQQHGITGWFTYFRELGTVATVLPFTSRYGGSCFSAADIFPDQMIQAHSLLDEPRVDAHVILPEFLMDSDYSRTLSGQALRHGYKDAFGMFHCIRTLAEQEKRCLVVAYWPDLDGLAHSKGVSSPEVENHFLELDNLCRENLAPLAKQGANVIISSDHGLIDTSPEKTVHLDDHTGLRDMLVLPLCGEPRCAYCYVRSGKDKAFKQYIAENLDFACELRRSSTMITEGYFGLGSVSSRLKERVGDYILVMKDDYIIKDRLLNEGMFHHKGVHGGLSGDEMLVPLIVL